MARLVRDVVARLLQLALVQVGDRLLGGMLFLECGEARVQPALFALQTLEAVLQGLFFLAQGPDLGTASLLGLALLLQLLGQLGDLLLQAVLTARLFAAQVLRLNTGQSATIKV